MGSEWRMPTKAEFDELLSGTTNGWVTNFNSSGVDGWKFTSKKDTSKYIFIPAAGTCYNGSVDEIGSVWSSSLYTSDPCYAWGFTFYIDHEYDDIYHYVNGFERCNGRSVRGVRK